MDAGALIAIVTGLMGLSGLIWAGLHFNRDDTAATVTTQSQVLKDMSLLNDDLRQTVSDLRDERDKLRGEVRELTAQVARLTDEPGHHTY